MPDQWLQRGRVDVYTADGTWTKPAWATFVQMWTMAAGGGGGSGRKGAAGTNRTGGSGGGAGGVSMAHYLADDLPDTLYVTVGEGSPGGAAQFTDSTNGNDGGNPASGHTGTSYVSTVLGDGTSSSAALPYVLCRALTGQAGKGGTNTSGTLAGGLGGDGVFPGGAGGLASPSGGNSGVAGAYTVGGTGGGGLNTSNADHNGNTGGRPWALTGVGGYGQPGVAPGGNGTDAVPNNTTPNSPVGGLGGGSGASALTGPGGAGGLGGRSSGGAGGGAAVDGESNSGAGAKGGDGIVWIMSW